MDMSVQKTSAAVLVAFLSMITDGWTILTAYIAISLLLCIMDLTQSAAKIRYRYRRNWNKIASTILNAHECTVKTLKKTTYIVKENEQCRSKGHCVKYGPNLSVRKSL